MPSNLYLKLLVGLQIGCWSTICHLSCAISRLLLVLAPTVLHYLCSRGVWSRSSRFSVNLAMFYWLEFSITCYYWVSCPYGLMESVNSSSVEFVRPGSFNQCSFTSNTVSLASRYRFPLTSFIFYSLILSGEFQFKLSLVLELLCQHLS